MSWTLKDLLLHGYPFEVMPDDRPKVEAAARRLSRDPHVSKSDRDYIRRMWLPHEERSEPEPIQIGWAGETQQGEPR